jgi:tRNA threonylcarbamoyl adenosine modification protein YeaZ
MNLLAFESSTRLGSVALFQNGQCTHFKESDIQRSHSENLQFFAVEIVKQSGLRFSDIDCFATGIGPGSFTGIRVSLNAVKTFSYAFSKPLVQIDSLQALAFQNQTKDLPLLPLINAYKNMSYYGIYKQSPTSLLVQVEPSVIQMKQIGKLLSDPHLVVGDGYLTYEKFIPESLKSKMIRPQNPQDYPHAKSIGILGLEKLKKGLTLDWKLLNPLYIRSSEAEETAQGIVWSPLDFKE